MMCSEWVSSSALAYKYKIWNIEIKDKQGTLTALNPRPGFCNPDSEVGEERGLYLFNLRDGLVRNPGKKSCQEQSGVKF